MYIVIVPVLVSFLSKDLEGRLGKYPGESEYYTILHAILYFYIYQ